MDFIKSLTLSKLLQTIGDYAFFGVDIVKLEMFDFVTSVGKQAFWVKKSLYDLCISIPAEKPSAVPPKISSDSFKLRPYYIYNSVGAKSFIKFFDDETIYDTYGNEAVFSDAKEEKTVKDYFASLQANAYSNEIIRFLYPLVHKLNFKNNWPASVGEYFKK
jgi:hypothetical protein